MHELLKTSFEITKWLTDMGVHNYVLIPDETYGFVVDVEDDVEINRKNLTAIPVKFNVVHGSFYCHNNYLTSLFGAPYSVGGTFNCDSNNLEDLRFGPQTVGECYYCESNYLTSLLGCATSIGEDFSCAQNLLKSLEGVPEITSYFFCHNNLLESLEFSPKALKGDFYCDHNRLTSLEHCPRIVSQDFYCNHNLIADFEFCPSRVGGGFYCHENPLGLGVLEGDTDFKDILNLHHQTKEIKREKQALLNCVESGDVNLKNTHKI